jgi:tripartite-type tricarboxylate transporter receptor subunit TctC
MPIKTSRDLRIADSLLAIALLGACVTSHAQQFPTKPVRYVVAFAAGDSPDIVARLAGDRLTRIWDQQVLVENRVGAGGTIAGAFVAKAPPDGYTLLHCNIATNAIALALYNKLPYDGIKDFAPITRMGTTSNVILLHPSMPTKTVAQFVDYARANPGKLSYGHGGVGASPHLSMELFKNMAKLNLVHVAYKGASPSIADLIGGQIPVAIANLPATIPHILSGKVHALGVTSERRVPQVPNVPTMVESGYKDYVVYAWYGMCAPAGTPQPVLEKLHADTLRVMNSADVKQRLNELVIDVATQSREEYSAFMRAEASRWAKVVKDAGIPPQ